MRILYYGTSCLTNILGYPSILKSKSGNAYNMFYFQFHAISNCDFMQIDAAKPIPEVFEDVKAIFSSYGAKVRLLSTVIHSSITKK